MSLVVLTSRGQDPAEYENHFGRGLNLPRNAEICLVSAYLHLTDVTEGITVAQGNNDGFGILYGSANHSGYAPYGAYAVKIKQGTYDPQQLASEIINALAVGNYQKNFATGNFSDIPVSPLRLGLYCNYDSATKKMKFYVERQYQYKQDVLTLTDVNSKQYVGSKFLLSLGIDGSLSGNDAGLVGENSVTRTGFLTDRALRPFRPDERYVCWYPNPNSTACLKVDPLWNGSNGAAPLQPTQGPVSVFGDPAPGPASDGIQPEYMRGWTWGVTLGDYTEKQQKYLFALRGGVVRGNKVWSRTSHTGYDVLDEATNRHDLRLDWAVGGHKFDLYWKVDRFTPAQGGGGSYRVRVYKRKVRDIQSGFNEEWEESKDTLVGEGAWATGTNADPQYNEVTFRPVDGKLGTNANAYTVSNAADHGKCCIDFRTTSVNYNNMIAQSITSATRAMTSNGLPGYVAVTDEGDGNFDLYLGAPIYMGCVYTDKEYFPVIPDVADLQVEGITMRGIEHNSKTQAIQSMQTINYARYVDTPANVTNPELSFLPVSFVFSPLNSTSTSYRSGLGEFSRRHCNIASSIGMNEFTPVVTLSNANSGQANGLESAYDAENWEENQPLAIIQLPDVGIDGDLGGGNNPYGGAISANILGTVPLNQRNVSSGSVRAIAHEPSMENWIKVKNLGQDVINQLKVKITDNAGQKLTNLQPDSNIVIKIKCGSDGQNLTLEKRGAINPRTNPVTPMERVYRNY